MIRLILLTVTLVFTLFVSVWVGTFYGWKWGLFSALITAIALDLLYSFFFCFIGFLSYELGIPKKKRIPIISYFWDGSFLTALRLWLSGIRLRIAERRATVHFLIIACILSFGATYGFIITRGTGFRYACPGKTINVSPRTLDKVYCGLVAADGLGLFTITSVFSDSPVKVSRWKAEGTDKAHWGGSVELGSSVPTQEFGTLFCKIYIPELDIKSLTIVRGYVSVSCVYAKATIGPGFSNPGYWFVNCQGNLRSEKIGFVIYPQKQRWIARSHLLMKIGAFPAIVCWIFFSVSLCRRKTMND